MNPLDDQQVYDRFRAWLAEQGWDPSLSLAVWISQLQLAFEAGYAFAKETDDDDSNRNPDQPHLRLARVRLRVQLQRGAESQLLLDRLRRTHD